MFAVFTGCSKINKTLFRNLVSFRFLLLHNDHRCKSNRKFAVRPYAYGFLPNSIGNARMYAMDTDDVHKKDYYSDVEFDEQRKRDSHWKRMKIMLIMLAGFFSISGSYLIYALGSPKEDEAGNLVEDEFSGLPFPAQFLRRMIREIEYFNKAMRQPTSDKLLPDPVTYPYYQPQYTLVLEMNDLLLHADWTYQTGWRFKKRPGVDKFLESVTIPMFELVVFTGEQGASTIPLLDALDPNGYIMHKLTRDSTEFVEGNYVKNLDYLNRDLKKVVIVDWNKNSVKFHRDNAVVVPRWLGQDDDTMLVDLAVFLRAIASSEVEDVREILSFYSQYENPVEAFRENQLKLLEQIEEDEARERNKGTNFASKWANTFLKEQRNQ